MGRHYNHTLSCMENVSINLQGGLSAVSSSSAGSKTFTGKAIDCHAMTSDVASSDKQWQKLRHLRLATFREQEMVAEAWHSPCAALFVARKLWET